MAFPVLLLHHWAAFVGLSFLMATMAQAQSQAHMPQVSGLGRGFFGQLLDPTPAPPQDGICAAFVTPYGYNCQEFQVKTEDGYYLSMQRIPYGRVGRTQQNIRPVLIQHGVLVDGMTWFLNHPDQNLPMILAENGFDVWIANTRGTRYSQKHVNIDPRQSAFWNWSWDELVAYDLPAAFNFIYGQTGQKIHYVGHSLGTLIALASLSERRLVDQLRSAALLSPVAYLSHMTTALGAVAARAFVGELTELIGVAEFNPKGKPVANLLKSLCNIPGVHCYDLFTAIMGKNCCLNTSTVDLFLQNEPQSTSTKNMVHLAQTVRTGVLAKYNYGRANYNLQHYGDARPPIYNLTNIPHDLPLFLSYGGKDALSDIIDVGTLLDCLKFHDGDKLQVQFIKDYAHADFIMGTKAIPNDDLYLKIILFFYYNRTYFSQKVVIKDDLELSLESSRSSLITTF